MKSRPRVTSPRPVPTPAQIAPTAPAEPAPPARFTLVLVLLAALIVRMAWVMHARHADPFFAWLEPGFDQHTFEQWARQLAAGDWLLREVGLFYYSPLFAYFCGAIYTLCGVGNLLAVHLALALLGSAVVGLVFSMARTWLAPRPALFATACYGLAAPVLYYEQTLLIEGLMLAAWATCLWGLRMATLEPGRGWPRRGAWPLVLAGAALGVAIIGRGNALLLLSAIMLWLLLRDAPLRDLRRWAWPAASAFALGLIIVLGLFATRNAAVSDRVTLGMSNGPVQFYLGNARDATGRFIYSPRFEQAQAAAAQDPTQAGAIYRRFFLEDLRAAPLSIARNLLRKTYYFWGVRDYPDNLNYQLVAELLAPVGRNPVQWHWLVPLGIVGLVLTGCSPALRARRWGLVWLFVVLFAAAFIVVLPTGRYRPPVLLGIALGAGAALEWAAPHWRQRRLKPLLIAGAAWLALGLALWPWGPPLIRVNDFANAYSALRASRRVDRIAPLLTRAQQMHPDQTSLWASLYLEAVMTTQDPIALNAAVDQMLTTERWPLGGTISLVQALGMLGRDDEARRILEKLERQVPDDPKVRALRELLGP